MKFQRSISLVIVSGMIFSSSAHALDKDKVTSLKEEESNLRIEVKSLDAKQKLEGRIEEAAGANVKKLKEFLSSLHQIKRSTYDVFCEVQREDLVVVGEPNVIGPMIVPAIPSGSGLLSTGQFLPVRKKWIDYYMAQIEKLYPMITSELQDLKLRSDVSKKSRKHYVNIVKAYNKLGPVLKDLDKITIGPKYDNTKIANCASIAQNYVQVMDKESKRLYKELRKDSHNAKRELKEIERKIDKDKRKIEKDDRKIEKDSSQ